MNILNENTIRMSQRCPGIPDIQYNEEVNLSSDLLYSGKTEIRLLRHPVIINNRSFMKT